MWLVIDGFMEENGLAPSPKKEIRSPNTEGSSGRAFADPGTFADLWFSWRIEFYGHRP